MIIDLSPDYNLFLKILLVWWILRGIVLILAGLAHVKKDKSDTYGIFDVVGGIMFLVLIAWVVF